MKKKIFIDNKLSTTQYDWVFDKNIALNFKSHVLKSIPFYEMSHNIILNLANFFIRKKSTVYDIGCSTGDLLNNLNKKNKDKQINLIGIDSSKDMIRVAKKKFKKINFVCNEIQKINFKKADLITSLYTIQFMHPKFRQLVYNKIYKSLNWGGAFIVFEKIRGSDARFQDILTFLYYDFKANNGLSSGEILNKEQSLRSVLEPFTINENIQFLKRAGFKDIMPIMQYLNFVGFLAIK